MYLLKSRIVIIFLSLTLSMFAAIGTVFLLTIYLITSNKLRSSMFANLSLTSVANQLTKLNSFKDKLQIISFSNPNIASCPNGEHDRPRQTDWPQCGRPVKFVVTQLFGKGIGQFDPQKVFSNPQSPRNRKSIRWTDACAQGKAIQP